MGYLTNQPFKNLGILLLILGDAHKRLSSLGQNILNVILAGFKSFKTSLVQHVGGLNLALKLHLKNKTVELTVVLGLMFSNKTPPASLFVQSVP